MTSRLRRKWLASDYWVVAEDIADEWRFHIYHGKSISRGHKVQTGPPTRIAKVRNHRNGYIQIHNHQPPEGMRELAKAAVTAVGYPHGAVDIGVRPDGSMIVFEVNLMPGMDNITALAYAKAIGAEHANSN